MQRTDNYGNVIYTYQYDSFGTELPPAGNISTTSNNPFRFGGEYYDWERGEYYLRARSYNPRLGRFTQPDPFWNIGNMQSSHAAIMQSANLFVFVMNNPVRWLDPSGMSIMCFKTNSMDGGGLIGGGSFGSKNTGAGARGVQPTGGGNNVGNVGLSVGMGTIAAEIGREVLGYARNLGGYISNVVRNYSQSRGQAAAIPQAQVRSAITTVQFIDAVTGDVSAPVPWSPEFAVPLPVAWPQEFAVALDSVDAATRDSIRFFAAEVSSRTDMLVPMAPLTLQGAAAHIMGLPAVQWDDDRIEGVLARTDADAQALLLFLAGPGANPNDVHGRWDRGRRQTGHFSHYHPWVRPHAHIWYVR